MNKTTLTRTLVENFRALDYASLPPEAIEISKQVMLDGLAVTVAGAAEPLGIGRITTAYVRDTGGAPQATVIGGGFKAAMPDAAYANGTMGHALDFDNTWFPLNHPTSPTLPAILAIAEYHRLPGKTIIEAIVTAFEVQARLRLAATGLRPGLRFHKPGTTGTFGATAAASRLLDLNEEQTLMALGLAGSRASSISLNTGSMTKSSHSGHGARMGVECALLARMGWTASADVFGRKGFFDTFMPGDAEPELLIRDFARPLRMVHPGVGFKKHPCNYQTHRAIDAALALRREFGIQPAHIDRVQIVFSDFHHLNRPQPRSGLDGKQSVQYTTAIALLDGEVTVDSFTNERRYAPDVVDMLAKISFFPDPSIDPEFDVTHNIVNIWLKDGRQVTKRVDHISGWVGYPLSREERIAKFFACTRRLLNGKSANRMLHLVERLETLSDVTELMDIARCDPV